jgi:hypothetical protein
LALPDCEATCIGVTGQSISKVWLVERSKAEVVKNRSIVPPQAADICGALMATH